MELAPEGFWRLSLVEWQALVEARGAARGPAPLSRAEFAALLARFPD
jgi:uncharacterized phage protein (TIGR02216 family)